MLNTFFFFFIITVKQYYDTTYITEKPKIEIFVPKTMNASKKTR